MSDLTLNGWVPKRRGILQHLIDGRMTLHEYLVFDILLLMADHKTGCGRVNAPAMANYFTGNQMTPQAAKVALQGLDEKGYIVRETVPGRLGLYVFKVQNYEVVHYDQQGKPHSKHLRFIKKSDKVEEIDTLLEEFGVEKIQQPEQQTQPETQQQTVQETLLQGLPQGLHDTTSNKEQVTRTSNNDLVGSSLHTAGAKRTGQKAAFKIAEPYNPTAPTTPVSTREVSADAVSNLVDQFKDKSKHWKFGQKDSRAECIKAFTELLGTHAEEEISDVIDYTAKHPMYGTAMRTISKKEDNPWVWFVKTYDEIHAHMLNDVDAVKRAVDSTVAKKKAISKGLEAVAEPQKPKDPNLPAYRKESGEREILKGNV